MTTLLQNKLLTVLLAVALLLGIGAEGMSMYASWQNIEINQAKVLQAKGLMKTGTEVDAAMAEARAIQQLRDFREGLKISYGDQPDNAAKLGDFCLSKFSAKQCDNLMNKIASTP